MGYVKRIKYISLLFFILFLIACSNKNIPLDKKLVSGELENGFKYYIYQNKTPENSATLNLVINVGSLHEEDNEQGIAHYTEHMAFNGTKDYPENTLIEVLKRFGMEFGADINAYTSFDRTVYQLDLVDGKNVSEVGEALNILKNWLLDIEFAEDEIESERSIIIEEKKLRGGSSYRAMIEYIEFVLSGSRYVSRIPIGIEEQILAWKKDDFKKFYAKWYRPSLASVVVAGDIDPKQVEEKIKKLFSDLKNPEEDVVVPKIALTTETDKKFIVIEDENQKFPLLQFNKKEVDEEVKEVKDLYSSILKDFVNTLFANRFQDLLAKDIHYFKYVYSNNSDGTFLSDDQNIRLKNIASGFDNEHLEEGIEDFFYQVERIKKFGFTEGEFNKARASIIEESKLSIENVDKRTSSSISSDLVEVAAGNGELIDIIYYNNTLINYLKSLKLKDIKHTVETEFDLDFYVISYFYSSKTDKAITLDFINSIRERVKTREFKPYKDVVLSGKFFKEDLSLKEIVNEKQYEDGISSFTLENGVEVYFKHNSNKKNLITLNSSSWGGIINESVNDAVVMPLAPFVVSKSGYGDYSALELDEYLSDKIVSISPIISLQGSYLDGIADKKDLETLFELIYYSFNKPKIDDIILQNTLNEQSSYLKGLKNDAKYIFGTTIENILNSDYGRSRELTEDDFKSITKEKLLAFYEKRFTYANNFKFVFVGDTDIATIKNLSRKYLGNLKSKEMLDFKNIDYTYKENVNRIIINKGQDDQSTIFLGYPFKFKYSPEIDLNYSALGNILTERLIKNIREKMGSVYSINASFEFAKRKHLDSDAVLRIYFGADTKNFKMVIDNVNKYLKELQKLEFNDDDFDYLEKNFVGNQKKMNETSNYLADRIISSVMWNGKFVPEFSAEFIKKNLSKDMVNSLFKKLNLDKKIEVILIPEKS